MFQARAEQDTAVDGTKGGKSVELNRGMRQIAARGLTVVMVFYY
jgi:hypothetical protein